MLPQGDSVPASPGLSATCSASVSAAGSEVLEPGANQSLGGLGRVASPVSSGLE